MNVRCFISAKRLLGLSLLLASSSASAQGPTSTTQTVQDPNYQQGFKVFQQGAPLYSLVGPTPTPNPVWGLYQSWTAPSIGQYGSLQGDGSYLWANSYKSFQLMPNSHVRLGMASTSEWAAYLQQNPGVPYTNIVESGAVVGQLPTNSVGRWPAFLLQESLVNLSAPPAALSLGNLTNANLSFTAQLAWNQFPLPEQNPANAVVQVPMFVTVQDLNNNPSTCLGWNSATQQCPYYGQYILIAVPIFATTLPNGSSPGIMIDQGTGAYMYSPGTSFYTTSSLFSFQPVNFSADIYKYALSAVQDAISLGYLKSPNLSDYFFSGIGVGWEANGLDVATLDVSPMSLNLVSLTNNQSLGISGGTGCNGTTFGSWSCGGGQPAGSGWVNMNNGCYMLDTGKSCNEGSFCNGSDTIQWACGGGQVLRSGWVNVGGGCNQRDTGVACH